VVELRAYATITSCDSFLVGEVLVGDVGYYTENVVEPTQFVAFIDQMIGFIT